MPDAISLRPHHLLCSLGFQGAGYSDAFTANMAALVLPMRAAPQTPIEIAALTDDICGPCPKRRGQLCTSQAKISRLDHDHAARLGLAPGDRMTWAEARDRIRDRVAPGDLTSLCAGCQWLAFGYCEAALSALHAED